MEESLEIKFARMEEKIDSILEKLDNKADKWVESFAKGTIALMGTSFISVIGYFAYKVIESIMK